MKERAYSLNPATQDCLIATFHSMCVSYLRRDADHIGYNRNFTIVDPGEQRTLMKRILKQLNLDPKKWNERTILGTISNAKNDLIDDVAYAAQAGDMYTQIVAQCYTAYQKELRQSESVDFDDLIMLTLRLFDQNPDVLTYYQQKFQYIHVDEYQDTNHAQYQLVKLLASRFKNICVVGDADQSIYGWRGADMQNILDFEKDYPQAKVVLLEENYRSTKTILQAANEVIKNNKNRRPKNLWTQNADGEQIVYYRANDELDEAVFEPELLMNLVGVKTSFTRILQFFIVLMRSPVLLRKPCSSQISLIPWLAEPSSTAVRKFEILSLTSILLPIWVTISVLSALSTSLNVEWARYSWENPWICEYARHVHARCFSQYHVIWYQG